MSRTRCAGGPWAGRGALNSRAGFALLVVLWIILAAASLGMTITFAARESVAAARNRWSAMRAMWHAHDCLERTRAAISDALEGAAAPPFQSPSPWLALDTVVARAALAANMPCTVELRATGITIDVNTADDEMVRTALRAAGIPLARADSMTDALLDWRDADDVARPFGAERAWYAESRRVTPRNGVFASDREIALVRGFGVDPVVDTVLGVESGRIFLARAPLAVIAGLPGMGEEALARIAERRGRGAQAVELIALAAELSPEARASLLARYAELARLTTSEPDAWIVTSRARVGGSPVTPVIEARLVRAGTRAAVVRRRSWIE
jgi:type II secretory pathway component PulK